MIRRIFVNYISLKTLLSSIHRFSSVVVNDAPDRRPYSSNPDISKVKPGSGDVQSNVGACACMIVVGSVDRSLRLKPTFTASFSSLLSCCVCEHAQIISITHACYSDRETLAHCFETIYLC